ncbi:MAG: hypothetical protein ACKO7P_03755, partial [Bacteroidota bacterium]
MKKQGASYYFPVVVAILDMVTLCSAVILATILRFGEIKNQGSGGEYFDFLALAPIIWILVASQNKLYSFVRIDSIDKQVRKILYTLIFYFGLMFIVVVALDFDEISRLWVFYLAGFLFILLIIFRLLFHKAIIIYRKRGG